MTTNSQTAERELVITRTFDAPRELVWKVWTEAAMITEWFGPIGFKTRVEKQDFRTGGEWCYVMIGPDGTEYPAKGVFQEIVPIERIVATDEFGEDHPALDASPLPQGMVVTELFEDAGPDKTQLTIRIMHASVEDRRRHEEMGVIAGWNETLDKFAETLATVNDPSD